MTCFVQWLLAVLATVGIGLGIIVGIILAVAVYALGERYIIGPITESAGLLLAKAPKRVDAIAEAVAARAWMLGPAFVLLMFALLIFLGAADLRAKWWGCETCNPSWLPGVCDSEVTP